MFETLKLPVTASLIVLFYPLMTKSKSLDNNLVQFIDEILLSR